jgi:hypothetical protein
MRMQSAVKTQCMETCVTLSSMIYGQERKVLIFCTRFASVICSGVRKTNETSKKKITSKEKKNETLRSCG